MARIDYGQIPTVKREYKLRTVHTYVRLSNRVTKYQCVRWIDNIYLDVKYKNVCGQSCIGKNKETGKWRILFVCEKVA